MSLAHASDPGASARPAARVCARKGCASRPTATVLARLGGSVPARVDVCEADRPLARLIFDIPETTMPKTAEAPFLPCRWPGCARSANEATGRSGFCGRDAQRIAAGFPGRKLASLKDHEIATFAAAWTDRRPAAQKLAPPLDQVLPTPTEAASPISSPVPVQLGLHCDDEGLVAPPFAPSPSRADTRAAFARSILGKAGLKATEEEIAGYANQPAPFVRPDLRTYTDGVAEGQQDAAELIRAAIDDRTAGAVHLSPELAEVLEEVRGTLEGARQANEEAVRADAMRKERDAAFVDLAEAQARWTAREQELLDEIAARRADSDAIERGPAIYELWGLLGEPDGPWPALELIKRACGWLRQQRDMIERAEPGPEEARRIAAEGWRSCVETLGDLLLDSDDLRAAVAHILAERARAPRLAALLSDAALCRSGALALAESLLPAPAR